MLKLSHNPPPFDRIPANLDKRGPKKLFGVLPWSAKEDLFKYVKSSDIYRVGERWGVLKDE